MRIDRLDLIAFGCFTDRHIELGAPGVHVISGPNEAGKSTVRHALDQLLYGMDRQTSYDFVHAMRDLRLGALVRDEHGRVLDVVRHKRDRDPLTRADGSVLAEAELTRLLAGVGRDDFRQVFALDHAGLRAGGAELLRGEGDVGRALFESRSSARLGEVLTRLEERAAQLYKIRGKNQRINAGLVELGRLRKRVQDDGLAPAVFGEAVEESRRAEEERDRLGRERSDARVRFERLDRVRQALPVLAKRAELDAALAETSAGGPPVGADVAATLAALDARTAETAAERARLERESARARAEWAEPGADRDLLAAGAAVDALHADVAAIRDAVEQADHADAEATEARGVAAELLARVRPDRALDDPTAYELPAGVAARVTALRDDLTVCEARRAGAVEQVAHRRARLDAARAAGAAIPEPADPAVLRALLRSVPGDPVEDIARDERRLAELDHEAADLRGRHGLADLDVRAPDHPARLRLPGREWVADRLGRLLRVRAELDETAAAERALVSEHDGRRRELAVSSLADPPPTPADWAAVRAERDRLWTLIRASPAPADDRIDAYERAVAAADEIAEHIARRAEEAVRRGRLEADLAHDERTLARLAEQRAAATGRAGELAADWARAWAPSGLPAPDPHDAVAVLDAIGELARVEVEARGVRERLAAGRARVAALVADFRTALAESGAPTGTSTLPALIAQADARRDTLADAVREREAVVAAVREAEAELTEAVTESERAEGERAAWERRRHELARELDLPEGGPDTIAAAVATLAEVAAAVGRAAEADRRRIRAADRVAGFGARTAEAFLACGRSAPSEPTGRPAFAAVLDLHRELTAARGVEAARTGLAERIADLERALRAGRDAAAHTEAELAALVAASGAADLGDLRAAVERSARVRDLEAALADHRALLSPEVEQEAARYAPDELDVEIEDAARRVEEADAAYAAAGETLGRRRQSMLDLERESVAAARAQEEVAGTVAAIAEDTEEFVRLRLAREVLLRCMEDYRKENQAPVLARAEEVFAALTGGRFDRLLVETEGRKGAPVLRARRAGGAGHAGSGAGVLGVDEMSEGTRDQLYLALRLASLDAYADAGRAMPIVLDDVAMTFDDGRTRAMLSVLDAMADRFQVVVFTHHPHLGRLAVDTLAPGRAHVHELPVHVPPSRAGVPGD
ncbi:YhaN family protein [Embleya hyalina]|uniref:DNA replication and repair protein RecF n=1 Tax=Embleya hyalina TaxID=516124 RepID=A0A401YUA0_9ACTN|nr:YhaN family protein [Embleya hyalina]GCD98208.1 DNA replication and repair protein RecF [Embleya hyalina]